MTLARKCLTFTQTIRERGLLGTVADTLILPLPKRLRGNLRSGEHSWIGRMIELTGDRVRLDGLCFSLDSASIPRAAKARLLFGQHELPERDAVKAFLPRDLPVIEMGGCIGVVSCLANRRLARPEQHLVVEANPEIIPLLQHNRDLNGCRFTILNAAVAYGEKENHFLAGRMFTAGTVGDSTHSPVTVPATTLRELLSGMPPGPVSLLCDIEGAEWAILDHDADALQTRVHTVIVEAHSGSNVDHGLDAFSLKMQALGFAQIARSARVLVFRSGALARDS